MPLIVKPIQANLTTDKDFVGKSVYSSAIQDPYCIILVGNEKKRTCTASGGGKSPQWSDTFQFNSTDQMLRVQVWDDDTFSDDMIGQGTVNLTQCFQNPNRTENCAPMGGGWGGQQGNWGNQQPQWGGQQGWGNQPQQGWGGQQGGWGNQPPQQGWGQQGGWGNQPPQQGWGIQPQQGWGGQQGGWGNQGGRGW